MKCIEAIHNLAKSVRYLAKQVKQLRIVLTRARSATLKLGEDGMLTLTVGKTFSAAPPAFKEFDGLNGTGNEVAPVGPLSYTSDAPSVATVDATSGQGVVTGAGTAKITVTDGGNTLSASDVVTGVAVTPPPAQSATLNLIAL